MSFQALARTWRPRRFDELVGQGHVVRALTHALEHDKLHHALLFSGTRGVGKTTLARIIAKCLNCDHGVSAHPCRGDDACATCREIDEGRFVDLIEVDAASRTGVDDTRELMDNVQYAPTRGRTKVYLIDEVHMLSKHSFNALLKTLEEPPPRVQFLLATTEPEKIPVTILSRCLQFPLKRLPVAEIAAQLRHIVDAESLSAQEEALTELARAADGSMRDGLSLLDQAIAFGGGELAADEVRDMLGTIGQARIGELVDAIIAPDAPAALEALAALYAQGIDMRYLLEALATAWQHIATIQIVGEAVDEAAEPWTDAASRAHATSVQVFYDICLAGIRDLAHAPDPLIGIKMAVLRMLAFAPAATDDGHTDEPTRSKATPSDPGSGGTLGGKSSAQQAAAQMRAQLAGKNRPAGTESEPESAAEKAQEPEPAVADTTQIPPSEPRPSTPVSAKEPADPPQRQTPSAAAVGQSPTPAQISESDDRAEPVNGDGHRHGAAADRAAPAATEQLAEDPDSGAHRPEPVAAEVATTQSGADHPEDWAALVPKLGVFGFAAQLANNGRCKHLDDAQVVLELARANEFLAIPSARDALQSALAKHWSPAQAPRLMIEYVDQARDTPAQRIEQDAQARQRDAVDAIENDPVVRQLKDRLGARVRPETIKPYRAEHTVQQRDEQ